MIRRHGERRTGQDGADPLDRGTAPRPGPGRAVSLPPAQRHRLSNGLDVLVAEHHALPVVDARLVLRAGAAADPPDLAGLASLAAELLDEGTATRDAATLADELDVLGAEMAAAVTWDATAVSLHVLRPRLGPALDLMADAVANPAFHDDAVRRTRERRLAELLQEREEPAAMAGHAFAAAVYGLDHPYGRPVDGARLDVGGIGRDDVAGFHHARFTPENAFLVVVGDVIADRLVPVLERTFGRWQGRGVLAPPPPPPAHRPTAINVVDRPGAPQSEIRVGIAAAHRATPDYFALIVLNTILGGAFTSRLNMRLREERGFTYGAGSRFDFRLGAGPFIAWSAVATDATDSAAAVFLDEIRRIRDEPVAAAELDRARSYLALGLPRRFETPADVAVSIAEIELHGLADDHFRTFAERVHAVSAENVLDAARRYLRPDHLSIAVVGDAARIGERLHGLGIAPVIGVEPP